MTPVFSGKLDDLGDTVRSLQAFDAGPIARGLVDGRDRYVVAVGSGGSAIAANFLVRCRETLGLGPTCVETPMDMVLGNHDIPEVDVWLFSAGAENADIIAAATAAVQRRCRRLHIVTRGPSGAAAVVADRNRGHVHSVPVATPRDGYLATHSMIATTGALLLASDAIGRDANGGSDLVDALLGRLETVRDPAGRSAMAERLATLGRRDTVLLLADPHLRPVSTLLETSIWETSICTVQGADFRNFAHGRHAWLHHRADETLILALTGIETRAVWAPIAAVLPSTIRTVAFDLGDGGRLSNALGLIDGLGIVEAMGQAVDVDPAKPGYSEFGPTIYGDRSLEAVGVGLPPSVRHKRAAMARSDERGSSSDALVAHARARLEALSSAVIGGLVFDYDGTLVATVDRHEPPKPEVVEQLVRLDAAGVRLGIATGRGGSAGRDLRSVLPPEMHPRVLVGYYNGGHLASLEIDIKKDPPARHAAISEVAEWLSHRHDLFVSTGYDAGSLQITVDAGLLHHPYRFRRDMAECPAIASGRVRVTGSGHSFDIVPATATKLRVVEEIARTVPRGKEILCFGDSGSATGNDHALLTHPYAISVGEVCGASNGCWSLFGDYPTGPDALLATLRALVLTPSTGDVRLDTDSMALDTLRPTGT